MVAPRGRLPINATMADDAQLLPGGGLILPAEFDLPRKIHRAFAENTAAGILTLATGHIDDALPPALSFWRAFGHDYLTKLCQSPPTEPDAGWQPVPAPNADALQNRVAAAPPAPGMEYLSAEVLAETWQNLDAHVCAETDSGEDLETWLKARNPLWRLVGRVTFHLAENKRSELFPFAFLATYTHRLSSQSKLQYLPLGKAVKEYAGKKDTRTLQSLLAPVQKAAENSAFARKLLDSRHVFQALAWSPDEAFEYLQAASDFEAAGIIAKVPDWWKGGRPSRPRVTVNLDSQDLCMGGLNALLSFQVGAALNGEPLSAEEWKKLVDSSSGLVSIKGQWVEVDREKLGEAMEHWKKVEGAAAAGGLNFAEGMRMLAGFRELGSGVDGVDGVDEALEGGGDWTQITAGGKLREILAQIRDPGEIQAIKPNKTLKATLRPYQLDGFNWLWFMHQLGLGACLADDMGLGKTIQVIATLLKAKGTKAAQKKPSLLVVPASLVGNWRAEIEKFAPSLKVFFAHPSQTPKEELESPDFAKFHAVITTYSMLRRIPAISEQTWNFLVLDEAQAIKNPGTAQTKSVKAIDARHRLALTGTPIENNVTDLWSLFDFLNPGLLGTASKFKRAVKSMKEAGHGYAPLRRLVAPYILRRLKTDKSVIADLPDKTEVNTNCALTKTQAAVYQRNVKQLAEDLAAPETEGIQRKGLVLTYLMRFKQICDHPALLSGSGNFEPKHSGKLRRLAAIAEEIASRGEKMLVFTQFREMTAPLAEFLEQSFARPGLLLHGGTAVKRRQKLVDQFQDPGGPPFFVISLKAGGTGLNLTAASHVVHFDRWWNPAVENQATDRAFRIGQKRNVLVHKFVCPGTIEEKIDELISAKKDIAEQIIEQDGPQQVLSEMSDEALLDFVAIDLDSAVF